MINSILENSTKEKIIQELTASWNNTGIDKGDIVVIHSSLLRLLVSFKKKNILITPNDFLGSFIEAVGERGTLIFPAFNFGFTKGIAFDILNTKSETGILTEAARLHPDSVRTGHPLFSFTAIGYHKNLFEGLYNFSAFGKDSPLSLLHQLGGKIAVLDVPGDICNTFYHYVEETENASYRYHKTFKGPYIDIDGTESVREFGFFARNLEMGVETYLKPAEEYIWAKGLYSGYRPGEGSCLSVIQAQTLYYEISKIIREGRSLNMLYQIRKKD